MQMVGPSVIGKTISHYGIVEKLGGGIGAAYKVEDRKLKPAVAPRFPPEQLCENHHARKQIIKRLAKVQENVLPNGQSASIVFRMFIPQSRSGKS